MKDWKLSIGALSVGTPLRNTLQIILYSLVNTYSRTSTEYSREALIFLKYSRYLVMIAV